MAAVGGVKAPGGMQGERLGLWQTCHFTLIPPCVRDAFSGRARRKEKKRIPEPGMTPVFGVGACVAVHCLASHTGAIQLSLCCQLGLDYESNNYSMAFRCSLRLFKSCANDKRQ